MSVRKIDLEALAPTIKRLWFSGGLEVEHAETLEVSFGRGVTAIEHQPIYIPGMEPHTVAIFSTKSLCWFAAVPFGELLYATPPYASRESLLGAISVRGWRLFQRMVPNHISLEIDIPKTTEKHRL